MKLRLFFILSIILNSTFTYSQVKLPEFEEYNTGEYKKDSWFLESLKNHFSEFVTITEYTNWGHRKFVGSLALRNDSSLIVTQTNFILDTPQTQISFQYIDDSYFKKILDSMKVLEVFKLKDEKEVEQCIQRKEIIHKGKPVVAITATSDISDGLQTLIIFYSNNKYRFISYYELSEAMNLCPELKTWKQANKVRDYLKITLLKNNK